MQFARVVERMRSIAEKQENGPSRRRDVNRMEMLVERQNRQRQWVATTARVKRGDVVVNLERFVEIAKRILFGNFSRWRRLCGYLSPWHGANCSNK